MAGIAGEFGNRLFANVVEQHGIPGGVGHAHEHLLIALDRGLVGGDAILQNISRADRREPLLEIHQRQLVEGLSLRRGQRLSRHVDRPPVLGRLHEIGRGIGGRIAERAISQRHRLEEHVGHDRFRMIVGRLAKPAVEPGPTIRMRRGLGTDSREIRAMRAVGLGEIGMLMAGEAPAHLKHLLAPLDVSRRRDAFVGLHIVEGLTRCEHVADHGSDLERLIPLRLFEPLALEVFPEAEEPWHLRARAEILRIPQPGVEPVKTDLARHMPQARAHLGQRARGLGILEERGEIMRPLRQLFLFTGRCIPLDRIPQPFPGFTTVGTPPHIAHPPLDGRTEILHPGVIADRSRHFMIVGCQPHVGPNALLRAGPPVDLVAAIAAVLPDQVISLHELGRRRLGKPLARLEVDHLMMTLQTARLLEPLRQHRQDPMMIVEPTVVVMPLMGFLRRVGRVRSPLETRSAPLPLMADRAPKRLHRMGAGITDKQVESRVGGVGLRHAPGDD